MILFLHFLLPSSFSSFPFFLIFVVSFPPSHHYLLSLPFLFLCHYRLLSSLPFHYYFCNIVLYIFLIIFFPLLFFFNILKIFNIFSFTFFSLIYLKSLSFYSPSLFLQCSSPRLPFFPSTSCFFHFFSRSSWCTLFYHNFLKPSFFFFLLCYSSSSCSALLSFTFALPL